jgi:hypothetical protein
VASCQCVTRTVRCMETLGKLCWVDLCQIVLPCGEWHKDAATRPVGFKVCNNTTKSNMRLYTQDLLYAAVLRAPVRSAEIAAMPAFHALSSF